jgi:hypothetical protein
MVDAEKRSTAPLRRELPPLIFERVYTQTVRRQWQIYSPLSAIANETPATTDLISKCGWAANRA